MYDWLLGEEAHFPPPASQLALPSPGENTCTHTRGHAHTSNAASAAAATVSSGPFRMTSLKDQYLRLAKATVEGTGAVTSILKSLITSICV